MSKTLKNNVNVGVLDTDFITLPGLSSDRYQLIYGAMWYCNKEESLYDLLVTLCKQYSEPVLLKAKLVMWEAFLKERKTRLAEILAKSDMDDIKIIFPTFKKMSIDMIPTVRKTISAIDFLIEMINFMSPDGAKALCYHSEDTKNNLVPEMSRLMQLCFDEFVQKDYTHDSSLAKIVNWEKKRRGVHYDASIIADRQYENPNHFREMMLDRYPVEPEKSFLDENGSGTDVLFNDAIKKGRSVGEITGVLYYSLAPKGVGNDVINKLAQYICYPSQDGLKSDAESTPYRYIHSANSSDGAFARSISRIRYAMRQFGLEFPQD